MKANPDELLRALRKASTDTLANLKPAVPAFELTIRWSQGYDALFMQKGEESSELEALDRIVGMGRCILVGRGGGGKSQLLYRVMQRAKEREMLPVLLSLREWTRDDYDEWSRWTAESVRDGAAFLIDRFAKPETTMVELDYLPPTTRKLLVVDGLNEVTTRVGLQILYALDTLSRDQIQTSILIADRLVRRELPSPARWWLGFVLPLPEQQIASLTSRQGIIETCVNG